jgi:hypothetical protein
VSPVINNSGDMLNVLDVLAKDVGIRGIFSDWPATVTFYANCMGINPNPKTKRTRRAPSLPEIEEHSANKAIDLEE